MNWKPRCKVVHIIWAGGEIILLFLMLEIPGLRFQSVFLELFYMFWQEFKQSFHVSSLEVRGLGQVAFKRAKIWAKLSSRGPRVGTNFLQEDSSLRLLLLVVLIQGRSRAS